MQLDYHMLRTFADSWGLLAMFVFFLIVVAWVFRPTARVSYEDAASIPFKED